MALLNIIPHNTTIDFVKYRVASLALSALIVIMSIGGVTLGGLNFGVDFKGGFLIEIRTDGPADLAQLRTDLGQLGLGDVKLQEFGSPTDVVIRVERQEGGEAAQNQAIQKIRATLADSVDYRRVESVGPKVSESLTRNGIMAVAMAMLAMLVYIWFRFEWQFGLCAIIAQIHDCISILGLYYFTGLEFNQTAIIAVLTTAGYSINDTVVIYDRIRENLRKYKKRELGEIINISINETLSRTILTAFTTLLALGSLYVFGGSVIESFTLPIICGITVGTYSSICLASILLLKFTPPRGEEKEQSLA